MCTLRTIHDLTSIGLCMGLVFLLAAPAGAALVTVEPDDYTLLSVITAVEGVTLRAVGHPEYVSGPTVYATLTGFAPTGLLVFGYHNANRGSVTGDWVGGGGLASLRIDFASSTDFVELTLGSSDGRIGDVLAFNSANQLLETVYTSGLATLQRPSADIAYVLTPFHEAGLYVDHLRFNVADVAVPEPSTLLQLVAAGGASGFAWLVRTAWRARRRT